VARASLRLAPALQVRGALMVLISDENIVLKSSLLYGAIWEGHLSVAVLDALLPLALVDGPIRPEHLTVAFSFVIDITALVDVAAFPSEDTIAVFPVLRVLTIVLVAWVYILLLLPLALAMLQALSELAHIDTPGFPLVLPLAIGLALLVRSGVVVAVSE
jgi:hypothetical protein